MFTWRLRFCRTRGNGYSYLHVRGLEEARISTRGVLEEALISTRGVLEEALISTRGALEEAIIYRSAHWY